MLNSFYLLGLEDAPETVTATPPQTLSPPLPKSSSSMSTISFDSLPKQSQKRPTIVNRPRSASASSRKDPTYDPLLERKKICLEKMKQREKILYNDAVECPICFLVRIYCNFCVCYLINSLFLCVVLSCKY